MTSAPIGPLIEIEGSRRAVRTWLLAVAALHGGAEPDLLDEAVWWQTDDFWQYAMFAAIAYIRAAADRAGVPVATSSNMQRRRECA